MKIVAAVLTLAAINSGVVANIDYCDPSYCKDDGVKHVACGHNGTFAATCPDDARFVYLGTYMKDGILNEINEVRSTLAKGLNACRMGTVKWDEKLAKLAALDIMRCDERKYCSETKAYKDVVQFTTETDIIGNIDHTQYFREFIRDSRPINLNRKFTLEEARNFFQFWIQTNYGIGCAAAIYTDVTPVYVITCNYGTKISYIDKLMETFDCVGPGFKCETSRNPRYPYLCSPKEKYAYV